MIQTIGRTKITKVENLIVPELKHGDITEKIIGYAFEVRSFIGNGFQEVIYRRALAW